MKSTAFLRRVPRRRPERQYEGANPSAPREPALRLAPIPMACAPIEKHVYLRSVAYRMWVGTLACAHCRRAGPSQAAHSDAGADGKGKGIKADDSTCFPACADAPMRLGCHTLLGATGSFTREQQQYLAANYARDTRALAIAAGKWPKGWP